MESKFEHDAKAAAVKAVERRFEHNESVRKRAAFRRAVNSLLSIATGLSVLALIAFWFANGRSFAGLGDRIGSLIDAAREAVR